MLVDVLHCWVRLICSSLDSLKASDRLTGDCTISLHLFAKKNCFQKRITSVKEVSIAKIIQLKLH